MRLVAVVGWFGDGVVWKSEIGFDLHVINVVKVIVILILSGFVCLAREGILVAFWDNVGSVELSVRIIAHSLVHTILQTSTPL
mgnify:CR=1 FL=1